MSSVEASANGNSHDDAADDALEIARLAALPPLQYERERKLAAEQLGIGRLSILDRLVEQARGSAGDKGQGAPLSSAEIEPWPEPVDGDAVLDAVVAAIRRYVVIDLMMARAVALWIAAAHVFDAFGVFPRLFVTAVEKGCGKTTLLDVVGALTPRPLAACDITPAALFRCIAMLRPCVLLDEGDTYIAPGGSSPTRPRRCAG